MYQNKNDDCKRHGIRYGCFYKEGGKEMTFRIFDKSERPRSVITFDEHDLKNLAKAIKESLGV